MCSSGIGWLDPASLKRWQHGQVAYLERVVQANLWRISEAMKLFRSWATAKGLVPKETHYIARTPRRQTLCFSKSGNPTTEQLYRTHWLSGELSERLRTLHLSRRQRPESRLDPIPCQPYYRLQTESFGSKDRTHWRP